MPARSTTCSPYDRPDWPGFTLASPYRRTSHHGALPRRPSSYKPRSASPRETVQNLGGEQSGYAIAPWIPVSSAPPGRASTPQVLDGLLTLWQTGWEVLGLGSLLRATWGNRARRVVRRRNNPAGRCPSSRATSLAATSSSNAGLARKKNCSPASVRRTLRAVRMKSAAPTRASSARTASLTADGVTPSSAAALRKLWC
jgi:hypothetical protein